MAVMHSHVISAKRSLHNIEPRLSVTGLCSKERPGKGCLRAMHCNASFVLICPSHSCLEKVYCWYLGHCIIVLHHIVLTPTKGLETALINSQQLNESKPMSVSVHATCNASASVGSIDWHWWSPDTKAANLDKSYSKMANVTFAARPHTRHPGSNLCADHVSTMHHA